MLISISVLICNEYIHIIKIICARHVQTVCNMKPKPWPQILGSASGFLVLSLRPRSWVLVFDSKVLNPGSKILNSGSCNVSPRSLVLDPIHTVIIITKCDKKLLQSVASITKCDRKSSQSVIRKYCKV